MKFTVNIPYIEKAGRAVKTVATAPKRKADEHLKAVMAQALIDVGNQMAAAQAAATQEQKETA